MEIMERQETCPCGSLQSPAVNRFEHNGYQKEDEYRPPVRVRPAGGVQEAALLRRERLPSGLGESPPRPSGRVGQVADRSRRITGQCRQPQRTDQSRAIAAACAESSGERSRASAGRGCASWRTR